MIGHNAFGHPMFDTTRSPLGELLYKLKKSWCRSGSSRDRRHRSHLRERLGLANRCDRPRTAIEYGSETPAGHR
jgi:hypothetical protein